MKEAGKMDSKKAKELSKRDMIKLKAFGRLAFEFNDFQNQLPCSSLPLIFVESTYL